MIQTADGIIIYDSKLKIIVVNQCRNNIYDENLWLKKLNENF